jgi:hypothetical protein
MLKQSFQTVSGTLRTRGRETAVAGRLRGDRIAFAAGAAQYSGRVDRDIIKGAVKADGKSSAWKATRKGA